MKSLNAKMHHVMLMMCLILIASCGGPRINRNPVETVQESLIISNDENIEVSLDQILIKNRPGSWAKDANWDEYIFTIRNSKPRDKIIIQSVYIEDIMGTQHAHENTRKALNKSTKALKKKYKKAGYRVKIGAGSTHATTVGISVALGTGITAGAVTATGSIGTLTSVGVGAAVAVPALFISGVTKVVYNTRVNNRIQQRQTLPPITINTEQQEVDLLFPAVPLPQKLIINYRSQNLTKQLSLDLTQVTTNLHIKP